MSRLAVTLLVIAAASTAVIETPGIGLLHNPAAASRPYVQLGGEALSLWLAWWFVARRSWAWAFLLGMNLVSIQNNVLDLAERRRIDGHLLVLGHLGSSALSLVVLILLTRPQVRPWLLPWHRRRRKVMHLERIPVPAPPPSARQPPPKREVPTEVPRPLQPGPPLGRLPTASALALLTHDGATVAEIAVRYGVSEDLVRQKMRAG